MPGIFISYVDWESVFSPMNYLMPTDSTALNKSMSHQHDLESHIFNVSRLKDS